MKVVGFIMMLLCLMMVGLGVSLWWIPEEQMPALLKVILSMLCCGIGIVFGGAVFETLTGD